MIRPCKDLRLATPLVGGLCLLALSATPLAATCRPASSLAERLLSGETTRADFELTAAYGLDEDLLVDEGRLRATVEAQLDGEALRRITNVGARELCVSLVLDAEGTFPQAHHRRVELDGLASATSWSYGVTVDLPETAAQLLMIVEDPISRAWGFAIADDVGTPPSPGPAAIRLSGSEEAWFEMSGARQAAAPRPANSASLIRIVPPRRQPVSGATRFDALVASTAIERVDFVLDGEVVASRKRSPLLDRPFAARIGLANPPRRQVLRVIAYDKLGKELDSDTLNVNEIDAPFRVRIRELTGDPTSGSVEIAAEVTVPLDGKLDRVELFRNETLVARFDRTSIRESVPTPSPSPEDYLRVAAFLTDGTSIDDVVLLADPTGVEEVDVNLVEIHVVANDADGQPVADLSQDDFTILHRGQKRSPQSFAYADDVTLILGVVIDTSGSMQLVMHDTRRAAAKFLGSTVLTKDRAFLVDFDDKPRLLHPTTADLPALLRDLSRLQAEGATALYDAIVFSMLQFERQPGRKALVILSDGDDHESRFGPKYCIELAQRTGVPIYIIGLGALDTLRRTYPKKELRRVTSETGGRLYFVDSLDELDAAYAQINAELRSQYTLSFYTDADLEARERRQIEVQIDRSGLSARTVVGAGSTN